MSSLYRVALAIAIGFPLLVGVTSIATAQEELSFQSKLPSDEYWLTPKLDNKRKERQHKTSYHGPSYLALLDPKNDELITKIFGHNPNRDLKSVNKRLLQGEFYTAVKILDFFNQNRFHAICNTREADPPWFLTV